MTSIWRAKFASRKGPIPEGRRTDAALFRTVRGIVFPFRKAVEADEGASGFFTVFATGLKSLGKGHYELSMSSGFRPVGRSARIWWSWNRADRRGRNMRLGCCRAWLRRSPRSLGENSTPRISDEIETFNVLAGDDWKRLPSLPGVQVMNGGPPNAQP